MNEKARPRFSDQEIRFLLSLCENEKARFKHCLQSLKEEQSYFISQIPALKRQFDLSPYDVYKKLRYCQDMKESMAEWLPSYDRMNVLLAGLVIRFRRF